MRQDRAAYYADGPGVLYVIHFSSAIGDHARHYMGWTTNLQGRLVAHAQGLGSKLTREAHRLGVTFALTWKGVGTRSDEAYIKRNRRLAELCSLCRDEALEKRRNRMKHWRLTKGGTAA